MNNGQAVLEISNFCSLLWSRRKTVTWSSLAGTGKTSYLLRRC